MSIFDRFDEQELLGWIEGDLDGVAARRLDAQLADEPDVRAALDRLKADRAGLQSLTQPELPADFVHELEPRIARSMLMDLTPGRYRRRLHRHSRMVRRARFAAIAAMVLIACGAIWAGVQGAPWVRRSLMVRNTPVGAPSDLAKHVDQPLVPEARDDVNAAPPDHHPVPSAPAVASVLDDVQDRAIAAPAPGPPVAGNFALVFSSPDSKDIETALGAALSSIAPESSGTTALVRNFTEDEARARVEAVLMARRGSADPRDTVAALAEDYRRPWEISDPARRRADLSRVLGDIEASAQRRGDMSERLFGPASAAPAFDLQLELSEAGATHCLAVPVARLPQLLELLQSHPGAAPSLQRWPDATEFSPASGRDQLAGAEFVDAWRKTIEVETWLRGMHRDQIVFVPIIVETEHD